MICIIMRMISSFFALSDISGLGGLSWTFGKNKNKNDNENVRLGRPTDAAVTNFRHLRQCVNDVDLCNLKL